ncbi:MAG: hypothetical protein ICV54_14525 [Nostoc sp. C3-bin3]|nr:hypothetical protein [Nostoc sp. C3-bin3]
MTGSFVNPYFYLNQKFEYTEKELSKAGIFKIKEIRIGERIQNPDRDTIYVNVTDGIITNIAIDPRKDLG